jgi:hypothetical protein
MSSSTRSVSTTRVSKILDVVSRLSPQAEAMADELKTSSITNWYKATLGRVRSASNPSRAMQPESHSPVGGPGGASARAPGFYSETGLSCRESASKGRAQCRGRQSARPVRQDARFTGSADAGNCAYNDYIKNSQALSKIARQRSNHCKENSPSWSAAECRISYPRVPHRARGGTAHEGGRKQSARAS